MGFFTISKNNLIESHRSDNSNIKRQGVWRTKTSDLELLDIIEQGGGEVSCKDNKKTTIPLYYYQQGSEKQISFPESKDSYTQCPNAYIIDSPYVSLLENGNKINVPLSGSVPFIATTTDTNGKYVRNVTATIYNESAIANSKYAYSSDLSLWSKVSGYSQQVMLTIELVESGKIQFKVDRKEDNKESESVTTWGPYTSSATTILVEIQASGSNGDHDNFDTRNGGGNSGCYALFSVDLLQCKGKKCTVTLGSPTWDGQGKDSYLTYQTEDDIKFKWTVEGGKGNQGIVGSQSVPSAVSVVKLEQTVNNTTYPYYLKNTPKIDTTKYTSTHVGWGYYAYRPIQAEHMTQQSFNAKGEWSDLMADDNYKSNPGKLLFVAAGGPFCDNSIQSWYGGASNESNESIIINDLTDPNLSTIPYAKTSRGSSNLTWGGAGSFLGNGSWYKDGWSLAPCGPGAGGCSGNTTSNRQGGWGLINIYLND